MPARRIRVAENAGGSLAYAIPFPPEATPAVRPAALLDAWQAARDAAAEGRWGPPRTLVFARRDSEPTVLAIADRDARCWADAVDRDADLGTLTGLALCLRLLALVELLPRAAWLSGLFQVTGQGIVLHPALLRAVATIPLDPAARFDAEALRGLVSQAVLAQAFA